ncbi:MAG: SagB/ThcOx family dehydrogenase [Prevotellaceae bacterium]|jgi:SagB-type dehydrogenase family enzyme|nr:SagB/ThcOx family dehydrogenase [Prevotellaceae bacterium]
MKKFFLPFVLALFVFTMQAQDINLLPPEKTGGKPFFETINERRSERTFMKREMPLQTLSNLLWVANGFNRPDKRTAPTGSNKQEMELYVVCDTGVYFYDAKQHLLKFIAQGDFKVALGQSHISNYAAVSIIMVADLDKSSIESARMSAGYISQNIYLFAASEELGTVARGSFNQNDLPKVLQLKSNQAVILAQPVGYLK